MSSNARKQLFALEQAFAQSIRDPNYNAKEFNFDPKRIKLYQQLMFNNIVSMISNAFPVLTSIYTKDAWHTLIQEFYARHQAHSPLFHELPHEFLTFLQNEYQLKTNDKPFLLELAHYEWVELALDLSEEIIPPQAIKDSSDLLHRKLMLSPLAWILQYKFPVHRIGQDFQPEQPAAEPTYLLVYRDRNDAIGFMELNAVTARLLELIKQQSLTGEQALQQITAELNYPDPEQIVQYGMPTLIQLWENDIIGGKS